MKYVRGNGICLQTRTNLQMGFIKDEKEEAEEDEAVSWWKKRKKEKVKKVVLIKGSH